MISVHFQGKPFSITVIQIYVPTTNDEEAEADQFYEDLQNFLELTLKRCPFHHRGLEYKSRKSRDTWSNRQVWPWSTKWSRAKVNRVLPRECTGHSKHSLPTTQEKTLQMDITRWSIPKSDWLYSLQPNFIQTLGIPYPVTAIHKIQSRKSPCTSVNDMYFIDVWEILK